jgi:hypothetical protein
MSDVDLEQDLQIIGFAAVWRVLAKEKIEMSAELRERFGGMMRAADKRMVTAVAELRERLRTGVVK